MLHLNTWILFYFQSNKQINTWLDSCSLRRASVCLSLSFKAWICSSSGTTMDLRSSVSSYARFIESSSEAGWWTGLVAWNRPEQTIWEVSNHSTFFVWCHLNGSLQVWEPEAAIFIRISILGTNSSFKITYDEVSTLHREKESSLLEMLRGVPWLQPSTV